MKEYLGRCHCGEVTFSVQLETQSTCYECNCSICHMSGFLHLIVPANQFCLIGGKDWLTEYRFNTEVAVHKFCRQCGIKPFYTPRSNPNGVDVNLRCIENPPIVERKPFDGQNWEASAPELAHITQFHKGGVEK